MSPNLTPRRAGVNAELPAAGDSSRQYPIQLDLRYKVLRGGAPLRGLGRTRELSSTELRFAADQHLACGAEAELSLDWPARLDGVCPLQLLIFGKIVSTDEKGSILAIARYEFRTRALPAAPLRRPVPHGVKMRDPRGVDARLEATAPRE